MDGTINLGDFTGYISFYAVDMCKFRGFNKHDCPHAPASHVQRRQQYIITP